MTPLRALEEAVQSAFCIPGCYRSGGALEHVRAGKPIPEALLPGRLVERMPPEHRAALRELTSHQAQSMAPWAVRQVV